MDLRISPNLWFDGQAEEAAEFYVSVFDNARVVNTTRFPEGSPGEAGTVMTVEFELDGHRFAGINGAPSQRGVSRPPADRTGASPAGSLYNDGMSRGRVGIWGSAVACALALALIAAPAASAGEVRFKGETSQGRKVRMTTDPQGVLKAWKGGVKAPCRPRGSIDGTLVIEEPIDRANAKRFRDRGAFRERFRNGVVGKFRARLNGRVGASGVWRGTVQLQARYFKNGDKFSTCRTKSIEWQAKRSSPSGGGPAAKGMSRLPAPSGG